MTNPLRAAWDTPFDLPPFDLIEDAHFAPALEQALTEARAAVAAICDGSEPTFENTIEALSLADAPLEKALSPFFAVAGADSNPAREELMRDFSPLLSAYSSEITANTELFGRIEALWQVRDSLDLSAEQARVLLLIPLAEHVAGRDMTVAEELWHHLPAANLVTTGVDPIEQRRKVLEHQFGPASPQRLRTRRRRL